MTDIVERLRESVTKGHEPTDEDAIEAADEIERLRRIVRDVMFELLIAQEDNQMTSAAYRGEWLGELIETCQRGLEKQ